MCVGSGVQTNATIVNIVGPTMLGVVACVLAVVCKRMQQLSTLLGHQCWELLSPLHVAQGLTGFKLCTTTLNNM